MVNANKLKAAIVENGKTQAEVAKELGITLTTFNRKLKKAVFDSDEIEQMILLLNIKNPIEIFFSKVVTQHATNPPT